MRALAAAAVVCLAAACGGSSDRALRLPHTPYLGLACDSAAVVRCERVGLAVWLARPARRVDAVVDGRTVALRTRPGSGAYRRTLFWRGFFRDPRAQRLADRGGSTGVRVRVTRADGSTGTAHARVTVSEGYG